MTFDVIATGSTGNAVLINGVILIDCGVCWKEIADYVPQLKLVLATHCHSDHFTPSTVRRLHKERPALRFGCCEWMVKPLMEAGVNPRFIDVYDPKQSYQYANYLIRPEPLQHNVPNCGYHINDGEKRLFFATDTGTLEGIEAKGYDYYLVEANHGQEEIAERIAAKKAAGQYAYEIKAAENHLSQEQALDWIYQNIGPNGQYVFLHQHQNVTTPKGAHTHG